MAFWRSLRRRVLTPDQAQTSVAVRGFHAKSPDAVRRLETVGRSFLAGYAAAAEAARPRDAQAELEKLSTTYRGFAYEGAAMAFAVRDGLPVGGRRHVADFLAGEAHRHVYMVYVGVGWGMARVPRFRWRVMHAPDPLLRWLVLDGYGFHQAYFHTRRYVREQFQEDRFPWPPEGPAWHARQVIDQGIGRAAWFVAGADPDEVAGLIGAFPEQRRPDLWSGTGLAATYAGGATRQELEHLVELAGPYRPQLAQGSAFAAAARLRAGLVVPHNELATEICCGTTVAATAKVTDVARLNLPYGQDRPAYAIWRERIAAAFVPAATPSREPDLPRP